MTSQSGNSPEVWSSNDRHSNGALMTKETIGMKPPAMGVWPWSCTGSRRY